MKRSFLFMLCLIFVLGSCTTPTPGEKKTVTPVPPSVTLPASSATPTTSTPVPNAKFLTYAGSDLELIPGSYMVVFNDDGMPETSVAALASSLVAGTKGTVTSLFTKSMRGFSVKDLTDTWASMVSARPEVRFVRKDFRIYGKEDRGGPFDPVPWNLDRIDQRAPFRLDQDYRFKTGPAGTAPPVPIYILDNGVYQDHQEFVDAGVSRVENVADVTGTNYARCSAAATDANHGTAVASIAAGKKLGITPTLIKNIKVLDHGLNTCTAGSPNLVADGLEAAYNDIQNHHITKAVVNLSMGWYASTPDVATQVKNLQNLGAVVVAAGGNENQDAAGMEPANLPDVLAVGATTRFDERLIFNATEGSNFGSTIALWAPGYDIKVADWPAAPNTTATASANGTSVAAPHVAGAIALLWQQNPNMNASQVISALLARSTRNMLTKLGPGSPNMLLYTGEDAPLQGQKYLIPRSGQNGDLRAVRVANDWTRVYVAGGDFTASGSTAGPFGYAGMNIQNINAGPVWQVTQANNPANPDCLDIHASNATVGRGIPGEPVYFGCMGTHNGAREAMIIATQQDNTSIWTQPAWLGPGSEMGGITDDYHTQFLVFAIATRPRQAPATGTEVFISAFDGDDGHLVNSVVLTGASFNEEFHRAVDLVLVDVANDPSGSSLSTELVAATYSDPPGPNKTFLWKLNPDTLQVDGWQEVPAPSTATDGMFATALAVQPLETNGRNLVIPGEVFLAGQTAVVDGGRTTPWAYIYRLNPDWITASPIEVVKDAFVSSLWSEEGDLYFAGITTRTFPAGSLYGTPKPGFSPDYDAFLGKSEGIYNSRRWILSFDTPGAKPNSGYGGYGAEKGYIVGSDSDTFYIIEYPVY